MKLIIRYFFKTVRLIAGPIMLLIEKITAPKGIQRPAEQQRQVDEQSKQLTLYQFKTCPFCIKVRHQARRLSLNIATRDAQHDQVSRQQLLQGGGQIKVPCLKIIDEHGQEQWLYESSQIVEYLQQRFAA